MVKFHSKSNDDGLIPIRFYSIFDARKAQTVLGKVQQTCISCLDMRVTQDQKSLLSDNFVMFFELERELKNE